jgi:hypothetical protein
VKSVAVNGRGTSRASCFSLKTTIKCDYEGHEEREEQGSVTADFPQGDWIECWVI